MKQDQSNAGITESVCWNIPTIFKNKKELRSFLVNLVNSKLSNYGFLA